MKIPAAVMLITALVSFSFGGFAADEWGTKLDIVADAGVGPSMNVVTDGSFAYSIGKGTLHIVDISKPDEPRITGKLSGLGSVRQIEVRDGIAYITSRQDGLFIVDVSDSGNPTLLNHYDTVEFATGIALSGNILAVACRNYGVELIDVTNPRQPRHISLVRTGEAQSLEAKDGYLYVGIWHQSELVVVDFKNPWQPEITARLPLDGYGDGVDVSGNYVYVATGHHSREKPGRKAGDPGFGKGHGLEIFALKDPAIPTFVSRVKFPSLYIIGNDMWDVTVANGHGFVADTWNGIFVVNVEKPESPEIVAHCPAPETGGKKNFVGGLAPVRDHILMSGGYSDLHIVKATGLATLPPVQKDTPPIIGQPRRAPSFDSDRWAIYRPGTQVYGVDFLEDGRAVVACGSGGIHIVDLDPEIKAVEVLPCEGFAMDVSVSGDRVYVAESFGGLSIWDAASGFTRIGRFQPKGSTVRQVEAPDSGGRILIQEGASRFHILDVSDPSMPESIFKDSRHGLLYGDQMMRGLVRDRYTAVHWHVAGTFWYDLKAEPAPLFTGENFPMRIGSKNGLISLGDKTLATTRRGYLLLDHPQQKPGEEPQIHQIGNFRSNLGVPSISGDRLYTSDRSTGLVTISDISDPTKPELLESFVTPGNPARIAIRKNGAIVIPDGYHGLMVEKKSTP